MCAAPLERTGYAAFFIWNVQPVGTTPTTCARRRAGAAPERRPEGRRSPPALRLLAGASGRACSRLTAGHVSTMADARASVGGKSAKDNSRAVHVVPPWALIPRHVESHRPLEQDPLRPYFYGKQVQGYHTRTYNHHTGCASKIHALQALHRQYATSKRWAPHVVGAHVRPVGLHAREVGLEEGERLAYTQSDPFSGGACSACSSAG